MREIEEIDVNETINYEMTNKEPTESSNSPNSPTNFPKNDRLANIFSSVLSSGMACLIFHPVSSLQTRFQVVGSKGKTGFEYRSISHGIKTIFKEEGVRALYQGLFPALLGNTVAWSSYFFLYNEMKEMMKVSYKEKLTYKEHIVCATAGGLITAVITNPIWLIKTRMQIQLLTFPDRYSSFSQAMRTIVKEEGVKGLYKGLVPSFFGVSHGVVQFVILEEMNDKFREQNKSNDLKAWQSIMAGGLSKIVATLITYPYQVTKSRLQMRPMNVNGVQVAAYRSFFHVVSDTFLTEGIRGFYRGCLLSLIRVTPSSAITLGFYYQFYQLLANRF